MIDFLTNNGSQLLLLTWEHLYISGIALALGILVAVPIGIVLTRYKKIASAFISAITVLQTVPSLALLALMIPLFGVGKVPAVIALFLYSLMPILRNTYIGMEGVDKDLIDAAKGMGMTNKQLIFS
ncbi:MAG: ABC transporter permease, partial [Desemzia incerta]